MKRTFKNNSIRIVLTLLSIFLQMHLFSQNWALGGNTDSGPPATSGLITNSNYFGGLGTADVRLGTGGVSRIFIAGTSAPPPVGFVGIGPGFVNPNQLLTVNGGNINVQNTTNNNGYMIGNTMTLWRGSAGTISNIFGGAGAT